MLGFTNVFSAFLLLLSTAIGGTAVAQRACVPRSSTSCSAAD